MTDKKIVKGKKGGSQHTPVESPNTLQANSYANIVDLICEGPIEGPAIYDVGDDEDTKWRKSTFYNETPVETSIGVSGPGTLNFIGF